MMRSLRIRAALAALLPALALAGCDSTGPTPVPAPSYFQPTHSPDNITGTVGQPLGDLLGVRALDVNQKPIKGLAVYFTPGPGHGSVPAAMVLTNADGVAQTQWTLGTQAGQQVLSITAGEATIQYVATARAGAPAAITLAPATLSLLVFERKPLTLTVTDQYGNPSPAPVQWSSSAPAVASADSAGVYGLTPGTTRVTATVAGLAPAGVDVTVTRPTIQSLSTGGNNSAMCALDTNGNAYCWGGVGYPGAAYGTRPVQIGGGQHFTRVSSNGPTSCGLTAGGQAYCWGVIRQADPINGIQAIVNPTPQAVGGALTFTDFSVSSSLQYTPQPLPNSVCGLSGGALYCWAAPYTLTSAPQPLAVGTSFTALGAGLYHTCALAASGVPWCWLHNTDLQLGRNNTGCSSVMQIYNCTTPAPIASGQAFTTVRGGSGHTCARDAGGAWYCWGGDNYNELTQPAPLQCDFHPVSGVYRDHCTETPVLISTTPTLVSLTPGTASTCGLTAAGAAYCWGSNGGGQLGDGTTTDSPTPVAVAGGHTFAALARGGGYYCGLDTGGRVWCWGANNYGQLGDGTTTNRSTPAAAF